MADERDVARIALSLPATSRDPAGFRFFIDGKQFAGSYMERVEARKPRVHRSDVLVVWVTDETEKEFRLATGPGTFFTTAHYDGYPAIPARLPENTADEFEALLTGAWRSRAPRRLVSAFATKTRDCDRDQDGSPGT